MTSAGLSWWMVRTFYFRGVEDAFQHAWNAMRVSQLFEDSKTEA